MLKNIPKILPPELLKIMCEMGHGDEIVIADGNFPCETCGKRVVRMDGHGGEAVLDAMLKLFPLDVVSEKYVAVMKTDDGSVPEIWNGYAEKIEAAGYKADFELVERYAFYERAKRAYAVIATGESALYANLILKKGTV